MIKRLVFLIILMGMLFLNLPFVLGEEQIEDDFDLEFSLPPVFIYNSEGRRDPFVSLVAPEGAEFELEEVEGELEISEELEYTLIGLIWDEEEVFALIQGERGKWIVKEGDMIEEFEVLDIKEEKGEVILIRGEEEIIKLRIRECED
ncbi:hypothetical protein KAV79_02275 [Candidatus Aerophobetes bacterium]|nr:hypothetical protein [Candidatus Aerophobetes bacterium]